MTMTRLISFFLSTCKAFIFSTLLCLALFQINVNAQTEVPTNTEGFLAFSAELRPDYQTFPYTGKVQMGAKTQHYMFRAGLELPFFLSFDASILYSFEQTGISIYAGLGAETFIILVNGVYAHTGLEFQFDEFALFAELQPKFWAGVRSTDAESRSVSFLTYRFGLSFYF